MKWDYLFDEYIGGLSFLPEKVVNSHTGKVSFSVNI